MQHGFHPPSLQRTILEPESRNDPQATCAAPYDSPEGGVIENLRLNFETAKEMVTFLREHPRIRFVDICFNDPAGCWHHCTFVSEFITEDNIVNGYGFDASSIPMFERIDYSDFVMMPDVSTCYLDPFSTYPTLLCTANIQLPTGAEYEKCPRSMLCRALKYMQATKVADKVMFGPEAEFFVFNDAEYYVDQNCAGYRVNGEEAYWNGRMEPQLTSGGQIKAPGQNLAHRANKKEGYMTSRPMDRLVDLRSEMVLILQQLGIKCEKHHHEVATCQMELNAGATEALTSADNLMILKYVVRNVASRRNKSATFMPKPLHCDNGSGMHCNQSLWLGDKNVFYDENGAFHQLSETAMYYLAGILHHCKALLAFACPTTNSYKRLVPDFEAPVHITYSAGNRSTAIRIPTITGPKSKRLEFRMPDASCSPYLAFASQLMAGLDGIERKLAPPPMGVGNLFDENNECAKSIQRAPTSLEGALDALERDHEFLLKDGVFTETFIKSFIKHKRRESSQLNCHPHPREFQLYYGI